MGINNSGHGAQHVCCPKVNAVLSILQSIRLSSNIGPLLNLTVHVETQQYAEGTTLNFA